MKPQTTARPRWGGAKRIWLLLATVLMPIAGCMDGHYYEASRPYRLERDYGLSVTNNLAQQVINPPSMVDPRPAVGLPPQTAQNSYLDRYEKSFKEKEPPPVIIQMAPTGK